MQVPGIDQEWRIAHSRAVKDDWFRVSPQGVETYGAGRYLDIEPEEDGTYIVDFNAAHQPFCAYAPDCSCPLAPAENRLPDRIEAGERLLSTGVR